MSEHSQQRGVQYVCGVPVMYMHMDTNWLHCFANMKDFVLAPARRAQPPPGMNFVELFLDKVVVERWSSS